MIKQNKRVETPSIVTEDQFGYAGDAKNEAYFHPQPKVLNIFPVEGDPELLAREALKRDLSKVKKIRIDPVNVCNLACVFLHIGLNSETCTNLSRYHRSNSS